MAQKTYTLLHTALAVTHDNHTAENHDSREHLLPRKHLHAYGDADYNGNNGLDIAVHAYKGRPDTFLPHRYKEICYERSTEDEKCKFGNLYCRN